MSPTPTDQSFENCHAAFGCTYAAASAAFWPMKFPWKPFGHCDVSPYGA